MSGDPAPENSVIDEELRQFLADLTRDIVASVERYEDNSDPYPLVKTASAVFMLLQTRPGLISEWRSSVCGTAAVWFRAASRAWARPEFLQTAISLGREALSLPAPDDSERLAHQHNLARALIHGFEYSGDVDLLDEGCEVLSAAVAALPPDDPDRLEILNAWGSTLVQAHVERHSEQAVRTAVECLRTVVRETPESDASVPSRRNNLGNALRRLAELTSEIVHLDEAIENYRAGLAATPRPTLAASLNNGLATALHDRFIRVLEEESLREAVECQRAAVRLSPGADPWTLGRRNNLSGYLIEWYDRTEDAAALSEAVDMLEDLERASSGRLERPAVLQHFANALHRMAARDLSRPDDDGSALASAQARLGRARNLRREVLASMSSESPHYPGVQRDLAKTLLRLHKLNSDPALITEARALLEKSFERGGAINAIGAVDAGRGLVELLEQDDPRTAAEFGERALSLARGVALAQIGQYDRRMFLREISELPGRTAHAWVNAGQARRAVTALELGRAVLHGDAAVLAERAAVASGETADAIEKLRRDFASFEPMSVDRRRQAAEAIRALAMAEESVGAAPEQPSWESVARAARIRPLLYLSTGHMTGVAIMVTGDAAEPTVFMLPQMTDEAARDATGRYLAALACFRSDPPDPMAAEGHLTAVCAAIDSMLAPELHDALGYLDEVAVVASGELSLLPFHLLGASTPQGPLLARGVVVTSCPSAAALTWAARARGHAPLTPRLLVAVTRGDNATPAASLEVAITRTYDGETTELIDEEATAATVLDQLGSCGFLHIVSHGLSNPWNAATSEVRLFDEPLSVDRLFTARPGQGRLALLTSCESAISELDLPDETSGLPLSLLHAGFGGVIGTSWPLPGAVAARFTAHFYEGLLRGGMSPAPAYRLAVAALLRATAKDIVEWAEKPAGAGPDLDTAGLFRIRIAGSAAPPYQSPPGSLPLFCWGAFRYLGW